ncbi:DHH family phosphoesterase [Spiroplasma endosymbiont of Nebria brevicollis]|uniref:DHH family phosphoesterase n=1 Tax=Spiroplasma endosymbiont of Nebria brevicollis TaxID=3066284 RepID=UPI00313BEC6A
MIGHPIWVIGIEYPDKHIRCELRTSDNNIKVNTIAQQFGVGGHNSAVGCKVFSWLEFQQLVTSIETLL